jgi:hypothetical protein
MSAVPWNADESLVILFFVLINLPVYFYNDTEPWIICRTERDSQHVRLNIYVEKIKEMVQNTKTRKKKWNIDN